MKRSNFSYELPADRIAQKPIEPREDAKLLVCSRSDPHFLEHARIRDLPAFLHDGDLLVVNETKVLPHRLIGRRATGGRIDCLILDRDGARASGFLRPSKRLSVGERLVFEGGAIEIELIALGERGRWQFEILVPDAAAIEGVLEDVGRAPLPPYLDRDPTTEDIAADRERYQTVFARRPGAVAAPTAGLHLTQELLVLLEARGVDRTAVTLHVGEGTFEPLRVDDIEAHTMHEERYELSEAAARRIESQHATGGRIVCVGTTSARVLESCWDSEELCLRAGVGSTRLFLYPGNGPRLLDALLTNFHLPESTLLLLVASILGRERTLGLYALAVRERYRFFSFGDAMLILP